MERARMSHISQESHESERVRGARRDGTRQNQAARGTQQYEERKGGELGSARTRRRGKEPRSRGLSRRRSAAREGESQGQGARAARGARRTDT